MKKVKLTGTLKTYKAIVVYPGQEEPEGYIPVAGAFTKDGEVLIALPGEIMARTNLVNKLIDQAEKCLLEFFKSDQ